ncbi:MAG TPA: phosphoribosylglycinamide formyltransferase [Nannocystaceae bacterium]|nr:phosphoribosylglycinamide formyltransferase [Nannocystaceae bacterium]
MSGAPHVRLGVLASGRGSNLVALHEAIVRGDLPAELAVVVSNNSSAGALAFARSRDVPAVHVSARTHGDPGAALLAVLREHDVSVVVLAGYMKLLDPRVVAAYRGRAVNIHPAPLPRFGGPGMFGERVHAAVLAAGVRESGPTVHLVDEHYDGGEILEHRPVPVLASDTIATLAARVLEAEHDVYWRAIAKRFA